MIQRSRGASGKTSYTIYISENITDVFIKGTTKENIRFQNSVKKSLDKKSGCKSLI